jgi:hypothetical protein
MPFKGASVCPLGGGIPRGDTIGVARALRLGERLAQRDLRPGVRGSALDEANRREGQEES